MAETPVWSRFRNDMGAEVVNHEQRYLMSELESLGLSTIRLNEFNNNEELRNLVHAIKQALLNHHRNAMTKAIMWF